MPINAPYHSSMEKEVRKAANILNAFFNSTIDADSAIPAEMIKNCAGLAFLTVIKAGLIWTGKVGTGLVIARLEDGSWSPPSGIGTAGVGFGAEIGGEIVDFMIVLGSASAVKTFKKGTQVSVGAGLDLAIGPVGRAAGASVNAGGGGLSGNYTYSHAKGMFAGVGLHGSTILVRGDMNAKFYGREVTPMEILNGNITAPAGSCDVLYDAIQRAMGQQGINEYPSSGYGYAQGAMPPSSSSSSRESFGSARPSFHSSNSSGGSSRSLPPPTTAAPVENDPRLRRYGQYKSEKELYAEFASRKSESAANGASGHAASTPATGSAVPGYAAPAPAYSQSPAVPSSGYGYTNQAPATTSVPPAYGYGGTPPPAGSAAPAAPKPVVNVRTVPASHYMPQAATMAAAAPRAQAPPIPPPAVGPETKEVYTQVMNFVSTRCPHANLQVFKDNCRLFGQDQLSLDAYFAYLTSICTIPLLKDLVPQLVRLLPTQDKRERLWAIHVREVLLIRS